MIPATTSTPSCSRRQRSLSRAALIVAAVIAMIPSPSVAAALSPDRQISSSASSFSYGDDDFLIAGKGPHREQQQLEKRLALVVPVSDVGPALSRIGGWSTTCREGVAHPIDLFLFLDNEEAQTAFNLKANSGSESASEVLDSLIKCFQRSTSVKGKSIYQIFTDTSLRQQFDVYDAIAVVDLEHVEVLEGSFERLYRSAFDQQLSRHSWWVLAADAPPLDAREARERRRELLERKFLRHDYGDEDFLQWTINGKAVIYNNRSRGLRRFLIRDMSPLLYDLPFDIALWATVSFSSAADQRWGGIMLRVIPADYLVVSPDPERINSASGRPIFLDISETGVHNAGDSVATNADRAAHENVAAVKAVSGDEVPQHGLTRSRSGVGTTAKRQRELKEQERQEEEEDRWARLRQELAHPERLPAQSSEPFTEDLTRGNLCVFVPGYLHQRPYAEVTVESVLRFMPGVRVAVAVDPSEMDDYRRSMGSLPSVALTRSMDVKYSAISADFRCGGDTELVLYLEPGALLSRPFTKADTHDPVTGELLVMSTEAARAGPRHATFAEAGGNILGSRNLPDFTAGTDLILPVSTNRDLRDKLALRESKSADWRIHFHAMDHDCFASEVHVPQILASMAFMKKRPGVKFVTGNSANRDVDGGATRDNNADSITPGARPLVLKPRFGCQVYSEVYYTDDRSMPLILGEDDLLFLDNGEQNAPRALRAILGRFVAGEEACASGLARLPWAVLVSPGEFAAFGGGGGGGGGDSTGSTGSSDGSSSESEGGSWMYNGFYSSTSALPSADIGLYDDRSGCPETDPCFRDHFRNQFGGGAGAAAVSSGEGAHDSVSSAAHREYDYYDVLNMSAGENSNDDSVPYSAGSTESETAGIAAAADGEPAGSFYSTFERELSDDNKEFLPGDAVERVPSRLVHQGLSSGTATTAITSVSAANLRGGEWDYGSAADYTVPFSSGGDDRRSADSIDPDLELEFDDDFPSSVRASELVPERLAPQEEPAEADVTAAAAAGPTAADGGDMYIPSYADGGFTETAGGAISSMFAREAEVPEHVEQVAIEAFPAAAVDAGAAAGIATAGATTTGATAIPDGENLGTSGGLRHRDASNIPTDESNEEGGEALLRLGSQWSEFFVDAVRRARAALS